MPKNNEENNSAKTQIAIALIGLAGVLGGALFANWDKIFPPQQLIDNGASNGNTNAGNSGSQGHVQALPDVSFVGWSITPAVPTKNQPVNIRIGIENIGTANATDFVVEWWPSTSAQRPAKRWKIRNLATGAKKELTYQYTGYPRKHSQLTTQVVIDPGQKIKESDKSNNNWSKTIRVKAR